jgi:hypothetical protein
VPSPPHRTASTRKKQKDIVANNTPSTIVTDDIQIATVNPVDPGIPVKSIHEASFSQSLPETQTTLPTLPTLETLLTLLKIQTGETQNPRPVVANVDQQ